MSFLLGLPIFRGYELNFRGVIIQNYNIGKYVRFVFET